MKKRKVMMFTAMLLAVFLCACGGTGQGTELTGVHSNTKAAAGIGERLEVHFIDVGQGDATLIRQGEHAMLIDAGDNSKGTAVQSYLQSQKVEQLDYVIGTHPDSDHIGGLDVILYKFSWEKVMMPELEKDSRTYEDVIKVIQNKNKSITIPKAGDTYTLGEAEFTIVAPQKESYGDNSNNYSIGLRLVFGENSFLFTGDAEEEAEQDMIESRQDLSADVLKAAHHGSDTANTEAFLEKVNPKAVVISCGENNRYGHPRAAVINQIRGMGADVYRTDEQGTVTAFSDGKNITWNCGKSESYQAGEPMGTSGETKEGDISYVVNENTGKFHLSSCDSVGQMTEKNRRDTKEKRENLVEEGYEPCKICNP